MWSYTSVPDKQFLFCVQTWKFIYIIIHTGWNLAWIFMKERVKSTKNSSWLWCLQILYTMFTLKFRRHSSWTICILGNFSCFVVDCWLFSKLTSFRNNIRVSNSLDPDQDWQNVVLDLDSNSLHVRIQKVFSEGIQLFFFIYEWIQIPLKSGHHWPASETQFKWCWTLNGTFVIFQGIRTSIAKKPYTFVIFQGGGSGPSVPPHSGSAHGLKRLSAEDTS